jgi:hypothetical protein
MGPSVPLKPVPNGAIASRSPPEDLWSRRPLIPLHFMAAGVMNRHAPSAETIHHHDERRSHYYRKHRHRWWNRARTHRVKRGPLGANSATRRSALFSRLTRANNFTTQEDCLRPREQVRLAFPSHEPSPRNANGRVLCETRQTYFLLAQWRLTARNVYLIQISAGVRRTY